jgi:hypothetical protein
MDASWSSSDFCMMLTVEVAGLIYDRSLQVDCLLALMGFADEVLI